MEVDAFLVLVLSIHVAIQGAPWAVAIGAMRYAFGVASWALPWLSGSLPTCYSAVVAALQGVVLIVAAAEVLPHPVAVGLVVPASLIGLALSVGQSVQWPWRTRAVRAVPVRLPIQRAAEPRLWTSVRWTATVGAGLRRSRRASP